MAMGEPTAAPAKLILSCGGLTSVSCWLSFLEAMPVTGRGQGPSKLPGGSVAYDQAQLCSTGSRVRGKTVTAALTPSSCPGLTPLLRAAPSPAAMQRRQQMAAAGPRCSIVSKGHISRDDAMLGKRERVWACEIWAPLLTEMS